MCGIAGIIEPKEKTHIKQMVDVISHRGPDDDGYFTDELVALGMRRLSIIDLAGGKQPITSRDGRFLIFFNGEIYNFQKLRYELLDRGENLKTKSDTEVVLRLFEIYGTDMFTRLRGMFAFAIYDLRQNKLTLVRDFFGIKPLYYLKVGGRVTAFSSEIKSFLTLPSFKPEINHGAVFNYLSYQYNPLPETFFKNVFKLPPAHFMEIDVKTGKIEIKKYWQFKFKQNELLSQEKSRQNVLETVKDSVSHHMIADVTVGAFLSGGIDSSIIVTLMQKIRGTEKVKTFNVEFDSSSEVLEARETAQPLGTEHHEISIGAREYFKNLPKAVWHFDEPVADPSAIGLYFLAREASKHVKVVLSGEGADELFGGYNIYLEPFARKKILGLPKVLLNFIIKLPFEFKGKNYARRASQRLEDWYIGNASIFKREEVEELWTTSPQKTFSLKELYIEANSLSDSSKMQYIDINTWLVGDILAKADKMTMAHSLELRVPFLDIEVAHLAETLPDRFKWYAGATKYLLREAFKGVLPESVRTRKKLGFPTPIKNWISQEKNYITNTILTNQYIKTNLNIAYIKRLIDEHLSKKSDNARKIYLLLMLSIWYNVFIENQPLDIARGKPL